MWIAGAGLRDSSCDANAETRVACPKPVDRDTLAAQSQRGENSGEERTVAAAVVSKGELGSVDAGTHLLVVDVGNQQYL